MRAAGLHPIATLLTSEAVLIKANKPDPKHDELINRISGRIAGVIAAGKYVLCNYNILRANVHDATKITPGRRAATVSPLEDGEWVAVSSMVLRAEIADTMDKLQVSSPGWRVRRRAGRRWALRRGVAGHRAERCWSRSS